MFAKVVAASFVVLCLTYVVSATGFSFGTLSAPKSGFVPTIAGVCALTLASINFIKALAGGGESRTPTEGYGKVALFVFGLAGTVLLMQTAGFAVAAFLGTAFLLKISGVKGWTVPLAVAIGLAGGLYLIFERLLHVSLP